MLLAVLLAAPQLLPTWELSQQSIRAGGLTFREAVSLSLQPTRLLITLLPTYGENLADRFGTPAYAEFVSYVGVSALVLAALGVVSARRRLSSGLLASPAGLAAGLMVIGLALALGLYNPLTYVLYKIVPGFGHRFHPIDPRTAPLFVLVAKAKAQGAVSGRWAAIGQAVEDALKAIKGRHIPMNIDGITAVIFCELGFEPALGRGLFILSRAVGILAHAWEQKKKGVRIKGPMPREIPYRYSGPARRPVPAEGARGKD